MTTQTTVATEREGAGIQQAIFGLGLVECSLAVFF